MLLYISLFVLAGVTSNPSRLLGTELDSIILQLKNLFEEGNKSGFSW